MARLRYVKTPAQLAAAAENNPEFLTSKVCSIRAVYETDAAVAAAVVPKPLVACARPEVCVTFSQVSVQLGPGVTFEIGSAIFGVKVEYEGVEGIYLITMPMTTEAAVIGGRETYGEPKKIAEIAFSRSGSEVSARVSRMGTTYLEAHGNAVETLSPRSFAEYGYCYKALPSCEQGRSFDSDPLLVRLEWRHEHSKEERLEGELVLRDSPFDPVADLPVRRLVRFEYEEGMSQSNGRVLRSVPGEWLLPFLHQRYDDPMAPGIEV